ncbi:type IV secretory system conjugative DNA transfer family protein, partial [Oenococcus oeni]
MNYKLVFTIVFIALIIVFLASFLQHRQHSIKALRKKTIKQYNLPKAKKIQELPILDPLHWLFVGTSGTGKTTAILSLIKQRAKAGSTVLYIDGKGDQGTRKDIQRIAQEYGRNFIPVDINDPIQSYEWDPLKLVNNADELADLIHEIHGPFESEYYETMAIKYWKLLSNFLIRINGKRNLETIVKLSQFNNLKSLVRQYEKKYPKNNIDDIETQVQLLDAEYMDGAKTIKEEGYKATQAIDNLAVDSSIRNMIYGNSKHAISFAQSNLQGSVFYLGLNPNVYPYLTQSAGALGIHEASILKNNEQGVFIVLDELQTFGSNNPDRVSQLFEQARSRNQTIAVATQTPSQLAPLGDRLLSSIKANTYTYVLFNMSDPSDTEEMAKIIGTKKRIEQTRTAQYNQLLDDSSTKIVDTFRVSPDNLKELPRYTFVYYN